MHAVGGAAFFHVPGKVWRHRGAGHDHRTFAQPGHNALAAKEHVFHLRGIENNDDGSIQLRRNIGHVADVSPFRGKPRHTVGIHIKPIGHEA